jgi:hypothetical protein
MKNREYALIFLIALAVLLAESAVVAVPGYMDAEYYYTGGIQLSSGQGFQEPFLWNYLDDPAGIPHPAFTYWMPLSSLVAALGMVIVAKPDFLAARIFFMLIAAIIPTLTARLSWKLSSRRFTVWLAAGLAVFPGFYTIYMGLTDTFAITMLLGTLFLLLAASPVGRTFTRYFELGVVAGLMHLARADGILWLACGLVLVFAETSARKLRFRQALKVVGMLGGALLVGYLALTSAWYMRNLQLFGSLFSPAGGKALWLSDYNQMFVYPASQLTAQNWLQTGLANIAGARWDALGLNLQTTLAVQGSIFLFPLLLIGFWRLRKENLVRIGAGMWAVTFLVMTLIFPLAGGRGGFFHSGAAFQPLFWALAVEGFVGLIELGVRKRNWKFERAIKGFGAILVFVSLALSLALFLPQIIQEGTSPSPWQKSNAVYQDVERYLAANGALSGAPVAVNNPPGYFLASGRPAVVIPDGDSSSLLEIARKYKISYLVLEENTVNGLLNLYKNPRSLPGLEYITTVDQVRIFRFVGN